jgi:tripartite-type tricarboxylate transporter receptor subunit TctC
VAAGSDTPASSVSDLKSLAKKSADKSLNHGVASSSFQLAAELFAHDAGVPLTHINYKGTGPTITALLGGELSIAFLDIGALMPHIKAGKIKPLAVTTAHRSPVLPDVPTVAESGIKGYDVPIWTGLVMPKGAPAEVSKRLHEALKEVLKDKELEAKLAAYGMEPGNADAAAFKTRIETDIAKWSAVAKRANIKFD